MPAELELVAGPQGGHHFVVHVRARGIRPGDPSQPGESINPTTEFQVFDSDMVRIDAMFPPYLLGFRNAGAGWLALPSGRILQVLESEAARLYGERVLIRVRVEDSAGTAGTDEAWVTATEGQLPDADAGATDAGVADAGPDAG